MNILENAEIKKIRKQKDKKTRKQKTKKIKPIILNIKAFIL